MIRKRYFLILLLFFSNFSYSGPANDNIVIVRVMVNFIEYRSYVIISSKDFLNSFSIVKESLW